MRLVFMSLVRLPNPDPISFATKQRLGEAVWY